MSDDPVSNVSSVMPKVKARARQARQVPGAGKSAGIAASALRDFTADRRMLMLSAMAVVVGVAGAGCAWALLHLIHFVINVAYYGHLTFVHTHIVGNHLGWWSILVPVVGCLLVGFMARWGTEQIRGHGIPEAIEAILTGRSRIGVKVAILKPLSSAISIGTGGPFGAEGPIIMTGGAIGSLFAQLFNLSHAERKTLLVAGAAAGMAATFGTPVAAMLLAVELLLFEWKPRSFVPVAVASLIAAVLRPVLIGPVPLFPMPTSPELPALGLLLCGVLGIIGGLVSGLLTNMVYKCEDFFERLPIHWMWWPAMGGLVIGLGGMADPRALGVGYDHIGALLLGSVVGLSALSLFVVKSVIWSVALGSGTSGGVLAPLLMMGGVVGVLFGEAMPVGTIGFWALIGMAATMGGTMRAPLTAIVFALELTHNFGAMLPLAIACSVAHATTVLLLKRSILTEKVARHGHHLSREYSIDPFEAMRVKDIMATPAQTLNAGMKIEDVIAFFTAPDAPHRHKSYPVIDDSGHLVGMVSRADALRWVTEEARATSMLGKQVAGTAVVIGYDDELAGPLADRMGATEIGRVPILNRASGTVVGLVARRDLLRVRANAIRQEQEREALIHMHVHMPTHHRHTGSQWGDKSA